MSDLTTVENAAVAAVEEQFSVLFSTVRAKLRARAAQVHPDLPPVGYTVLSLLVRCGPLHGRQIAELLGMDKSSISRQVAGLETMGLVTREPDPADGRAYLLAASDEARAKVRGVKESERAALHQRLRDWPEGDVAKLAELLARLNG